MAKNHKIITADTADQMGRCIGCHGEERANKRRTFVRSTTKID